MKDFVTHFNLYSIKRIENTKDVASITNITNEKYKIKYLKKIKHQNIKLYLTSTHKESQQIKNISKGR